MLLCSWPMKCTVSRSRCDELGALGRGLLVAVLAEVAYAQLGEQVDVGGREELRDDDEAPARRSRPASAMAARDALAGTAREARRRSSLAPRRGVAASRRARAAAPARRRPRSGRSARRAGRSRGRRAPACSPGTQLHRDAGRRAAARPPRRRRRWPGVPVHDRVALTGCTARGDVAHLRGHLVAAPADRRARRRLDLAGAEVAHHLEGARHDAGDHAGPAGVDGRRPPRPVPDSSTGTQSATSTARASLGRPGDHAVAARRHVGHAVDDGDLGAVALVHVDDAARPSRSVSRRRFSADGVRVVVDVGAEVEPGVAAGAHPGRAVGDGPDDTGSVLMPGEHPPTVDARWGGPDGPARPALRVADYLRKSGTSRSSFSSKVTVRGGGGLLRRGPARRGGSACSVTHGRRRRPTGGRRGPLGRRPARVGRRRRRRAAGAAGGRGRRGPALDRCRAPGRRPGAAAPRRRSRPR